MTDGLIIVPGVHSPIRRDLPLPIPKRMRSLPVDRRGYPVPYFVAWLDDGEPCKRGEGTPDFRIVFPGAVARCVQEDRCWLCGRRITGHKSFVIGPMCAINRNNAEPPSHPECADWAARACPFLATPNRTRSKRPMPSETIEAAGIPVLRNPGVACVWTVVQYAMHRDPNGGLLFRLTNPTSVMWYCEGRPATRAEVQASIDGGLPVLREYCDGPDDHAALEAELRSIERYLPRV